MVEESIPDEKRIAEMKAVNPQYIPRNHRIQQAIDAWIDLQDRGPFDDLLAVTAHPFEDSINLSHLADPPKPQEVVRQTFCGT